MNKENCGSPHVTEQKYPNQTREFVNVINGMYKTHLDKNKDYSPANITIAGELGIIVRMWDKMSRIFNLMGMSFPAMNKEIHNSWELLHKTITDDYKKWQNDATGDRLLDVERMEKNTHDIIDGIFRELIDKTSLDYTKYEEKIPANEPLDDAFKDLAVYSIVAMIYRSGNWGR